MKKVVLLSLAVIISLNALALFILDDERDAYFAFLDKNEEMLESQVFDLVNEKIIILSAANIKTYERIINGQRIVEFQFIRDSLDVFSYHMPQKDLFSLEQKHLMEAYKTGSSLLRKKSKAQFSSWGLFKRNSLSSQTLEYLKNEKSFYLQSNAKASPWTFNWSILSYFLLVVLFILFIFFQVYRQAPNRKRKRGFFFPVAFSPFLVLFFLLLIDYFISSIANSTEMSLFHLIFISDNSWIQFFGIKDELFALQALKGIYLVILFFLPFLVILITVFYYKGDIVFTAPLLLTLGFIFMLFFPLILIQKIFLFIVLLFFSIFLFLFIKKNRSKKIKEMYQKIKLL